MDFVKFYVNDSVTNYVTSYVNYSVIDYLIYFVTNYVAYFVTIYVKGYVKDYLEENAYKHEWEVGDLLIWDNLKMNHKRVSFEGERLLWRTQFMI